MKLQDFDFRIWDNERQEYLSDTCISFENGEKEITKYFIGLDGTIGGYDDEGNCFDIDNQESLEIELYTGIKDKNRQMVYENDIIAWDNNPKEKIIKAKILKDEYETSFYAKIENDELMSLKQLNPYFRVIGNIHENTDLLESREFESKKLNCENNRRCKCPTSEQKIYI